MNFSDLEKNICGMIKEGQVKLGYQKETLHLYYPLLTLNRFLHSDLDTEEMRAALEEFSAAVEDKLGKIQISNQEERFCFCLPPEASEYVHTHTSQTGFLYDFIETISKHGVTMEEVINQFQKYSDHVQVEKSANGEFDYLVYFEDGNPDTFRYCMKEEGHHISYHRFTADDCNDFQTEQ